ncbi:MAG: hypothetical protein JSV16_07920, partial [Candidatus Hydrogenedentota bacterium]
RELLSIFNEAGTIRRNPVDASAHGIFPQNIGKINRIIDSDPNIDCVLYAYQLNFLERNIKRIGLSVEDAFSLLVEVWEGVKARVRAPVALALSRDSDELEAEEFRLILKQRLLAAGVPAFDSVRAAGLVLLRMHQFRRARERVSGRVQ